MVVTSRYAIGNMTTAGIYDHPRARVVYGP